jgi:hypothetical protein
LVLQGIERCQGNQTISWLSPAELYWPLGLLFSIALSC